MVCEVQDEMPLSDEPTKATESRPDLPEDFKDLVGFLSHYCKGPENAATAKDIAKVLNFKGKDPRRYVTNLVSIHYADFPFIVCGAGGRGFFVATEPEHLDHEHASLHSRLQALAHRIYSFKRVARKTGYDRIGTGRTAKFTERNVLL